MNHYQGRHQQQPLKHQQKVTAGSPSPAPAIPSEVSEFGPNKNQPRNCRVSPVALLGCGAEVITGIEALL